MQIAELYRLYLESTGVTTDTRSIAAGNIFFALKGEKFNANLFASDAFQHGAKAVVVDEISEPEWRTRFKDKLVLVDNVLSTLQQLAFYHRQQLKAPVLAITGSNGKTTTKELLAVVLSEKFKTAATRGNYNNHIGVPLTLLSIPTDIEFAVIEMGANHIGEIASYCEYTAPDCGLITNVGMAHTEGFGSFEGVIQGKTELYRHLERNKGTVFVCADNEILMRESKNVKHRVTYGKSKSADCKGEIISVSDFLTVRTEGLQIQTNLVGDYNFENVMSAVCVGRHFDIPIEQIKKAIESYSPSNNRSQKTIYNGATIILDAYNANPSSMSEALKNFEKIKSPLKAVILGEMMELGQYSEAEHEKIALEVSDLQLAKSIFVGRGFEFLRDEPDAKWFGNTDALKVWFKQQDWNDYYILIKGSRKNELEKILK